MNALLNYLKVNSLESLTKDFGILVKNYGGDLYNLSYTNYASPKYNDIVAECRGIIIDKDLNILARPFDRFYNYGENPNQEEIDFSETFVYDKLDGSLIKIWWYPKEQRWCVGTSGTAFCELGGDGARDFKKLTYVALDVKNDKEFNDICDLVLSRNDTHLFELTSPFNRVVVKYQSTKLHYLNSRSIETGLYNRLHVNQTDILGCEVAKLYDFKSVEDMKVFNDKHTVDDVKEGFIVCDKNHKPILKIKSDLYVQIHYTRGEELTHRRIVYMFIRGDQDEYLTYFPDDAKYFQRYFDVWNFMIVDIIDLYRIHKDQSNREISGLLKGDFRMAAINGMVKLVNDSDTDVSPLDYLDKTLEMFRYKMFMNYFKQLGYEVIDYAQ